MMTLKTICSWLQGLTLLLVISACQPNGDVAPVILATAITQQQIMTPMPTVVLASETPLPPVSSLTPTVEVVTISLAASATPMPTATVQSVTLSLAEPVTPIPTATIAPSDTPQPTPARFVDHYLLERPISQTGDKVHWVDRTYPYGGTQFGTREVHLGVEFVNTRFTNVLATAPGEVVFAGTDTSDLLGPELNYYGNVVLIQHDFAAPDGQPVYTLYGHLQDFMVSAGQRVESGEIIGRVGDSGIAIGPHLHFEVRVGGTGRDYRNTRNPELWIRPYFGYGTLAGNVTAPALDEIIVLVRNETLNRETYVYGSQRVNSDLAWGENFTLGDLPEGSYEVIINAPNGRNLYRETIEVAANRTTYLEIVLE